MKYWIFAGLLVTAPMAAFTVTQVPQGHETYHLVDTDTMKSWYDQKVDMTVVDARGIENYDHATLPNAKWVPSYASEKMIFASLPSKEKLVAVYSCHAGCPAGRVLAARLVAMGYKNVHIYVNGLQEWMGKGHPIMQKK